MDSHRTIPRGAVTALLVVLFTTSGAFAQSDPGLTLLGEASSYDLSGTGTTWVAGAEGDVSPFRHLGISPAVRLFRYETQGEVDASFLFTELTVRFQAPVDRFRPYLGAGLGAGLAAEGSEQDDLTLHAALGTFVKLDSSWSLRPEFPVRINDAYYRALGSFGRSALERALPDEQAELIDRSLRPYRGEAWRFEPRDTLGSKYGGKRIDAPMALLPDGTPVVRHGIRPDIAVEETVEDIRQGRDPVVRKAVEELRGGSGT